MPVGIVMRRTPGASRWVKWTWRAVAALPGAEDADWRELRREGEAVEFHAATGQLELHQADVESYYNGLEAAAPSLWAIFHATGDVEKPWALHQITASPDEALNALDSAEDLVERVPLTPAIAGWIAEFVEAHYHPEPFRKRKRVPADPEAFDGGRGDARIRQHGDVFRAPGEMKRGEPT